MRHSPRSFACPSAMGLLLRRLVGVSLSALAGCHQQAPPSSLSDADVPCAPVVAVAVDDHSESPQGKFVPLEAEDIEPLLARVGECGGTLAYAFVDEDSDEAFLRFDADPLRRPRRPALSGTGRAVLDSLAAYNRARGAFVADSSQQAAGRASFMRELRRRLESPRDAQRTDLATALERAGIVFAEPRPIRPGALILLVFSDGEDNVRGSLPPLPPGVRVVSVGGSKEALPEMMRGEVYESPRVALRSVIVSLHNP